MTDHIREKLVELLWEAWAYAEEVCGCTACSDCPAGPKNAKCMTTLAADHLLANGATVQEWISVEDRLPKEGDIVLCYMEFGEQRMAWWDESENCWAGQLIDYHKEQVTHWMPLPSAPKGE